MIFKDYINKTVKGDLSMDIRNDIKKQDHMSVANKNEQLLQFIVDINNKLSTFSEFNDIYNVATKSIMDFFGANRCFYCEIIGDTVIICHDSYRKGFTSLIGTYQFSKYPICMSTLQKKEMFFIKNIHDTNLLDKNLKLNLINNNIISCLIIPIKKEENISGFFVISKSKPNDWDNMNVKLLSVMANQIWNVLEIIKLKNDSRLKADFFSLLCHELRNPLLNLSLGLNLMDSIEDDKKEQEKIRTTLKRQVDQLTRLVDDLFKIIVITQDKVDYKFENLELNILLEEIVQDSYLYFSRKKIKLDLKLPDKEIYIKGDKFRLIQVIENILNNAFKFTPDKGSVFVVLKKDDLSNKAIISIKDTGRGIPSNLLESIFELYVRVGNNHEKSSGGLGIGLYIVKEIIKKHKGSIKALSDGDGMGTELIIELPII